MWVMTTTEYQPHWIDLDGAVNARTVVPRVLLRSDNLQGLSERDVRELVDIHQLEVVLDLRTGNELRLEGPGPMTREPRVRIEHRSLYPEHGNTDVDIYDAVRPWGSHESSEYPDERPTVRAYMGYLTRRPDSVAESVRTIAETSGAVLVHCAAGKDRTGVVVAVALDAAGWDREVIVADYLASTDRIDQILARLLSSETYRADIEANASKQHAPLPGAMERVLELIDERFGGTKEWLRANGLDDSELERLTDRLAPASAA
jgi:protein tyrosine/serine phosphatase